MKKLLKESKDISSIALMQPPSASKKELRLLLRKKVVKFHFYGYKNKKFVSLLIFSKF